MESFQFFVTVYRKDKGLEHSEYYFKARDINELKEKFLDFLDTYQEKLKSKKSPAILPKVNHIIPHQLKYRVKFTPRKEKE